MLVLLPPSETKSVGGNGSALDLAALSFPELTPVRDQVATALVALAADVPASLAALDLSERQVDEVERNAALFAAPTRPALERYTGVLYDAMAIPSFTKAQRRRADARLAVASALFGVLRAADPIPAYRLSGASVLPALGPLRPLWRPSLEKTLSTVDDLLIDLRSGAYANLATTPTAITVRVVTESPDGRRKTVSHFNKAYKGRLAAALATTPREPTTIRGLISVAAAAGLTLTKTPTPNALDLVVTP